MPSDAEDDFDEVGEEVYEEAMSMFRNFLVQNKTMFKKKPRKAPNNPLPDVQPDELTANTSADVQHGEDSSLVEQYSAHPLLMTVGPGGSLPPGISGSAPAGFRGSYGEGSTMHRVITGSVAVNPSSSTSHTPRYATQDKFANMRTSLVDVSTSSIAQLNPNQASAATSSAVPNPAPPVSANTTTNPPTFTNIGIPSTSNVAEVPVVDYVSGARRLRATLGKSREGRTEAEIQAAGDELEKWSNTPEDTMNPHTKKEMYSMLVTWGIIIKDRRPDMPEEDFWKSTTVEAYANYYLTKRVEVTSGRGGRSHVMARTLMAWLTRLCWLIARFCRDPVTGLRNGVQVLVRGLYSNLENHCLRLVHHYKLQRHKNPQPFLYMEDIYMLIGTALDRSEQEGRIVKLQHIVSWIIMWATMVRPSSLGPSSPLYEKRGQFPKLKDVWHVRIGYGFYSVPRAHTYCKGEFNTMVSKLRKYVIHPPHKAQHAVFSGILILLLQFLRGAFGDRTLQEVLDDPSAELRVIPEMEDEPLFLAGTQGGRWLDLKNKRPAMSHAFTDTLREVGKHAKMDLISARAIRRGSADAASQIIGHEITTMLLGHAGRRQYSLLIEYYSNNVTNIPLSKILLGDIEPPPFVQKTYTISKKNQLLSSSLAVMAMVRRKAIKESIIEANESRMAYNEEDVEWFESEIKKHEESSSKHPKLALETAYDIWKISRSAIVYSENLTNKDARRIKKEIEKAEIAIKEVVRVRPENRTCRHLKSILTRLAKLELMAMDEWDEESESCVEVLTSATEDEPGSVLLAAFRDLRLMHKGLRRRRDEEKVKQSLRGRPPPEIDSTENRREAVETIERDMVYGSELLRKSLRSEDSEEPLRYKDVEAVTVDQVLTSEALEQNDSLEDFIHNEWRREEEESPSDSTTYTENLSFGPKTNEMNSLLSETAKKMLGPDGEEPTSSTEAASNDAAEPDPELCIIPRPVDDQESIQDSTQDSTTSDSDEIETVEFSLDDKNETDLFKNTTVGEVSVRLIHYVATAYYKQVAIQKEMKQRNGGEGIGCPSCARLVHQPDRVNHLWPSQSTLTRHISDVHNPWIDLEGWCCTEDITEWKCVKCEKLFPNMEAVRYHGLHECSSKDFYQQLYDNYQESKNDPKRRGRTSRRLDTEGGGLTTDNVMQSLSDSGLLDQMESSQVANLRRGVGELLVQAPNTTSTTASIPQRVALEVDDSDDDEFYEDAVATGLVDIRRKTG
ncbi:hypothetical protein FRC02_009934 [Tulasnella sp. 418]|nr:hypothetical protein FRC02_009934 [Tulasnella sp. 418]